MASKQCEGCGQMLSLSHYYRNPSVKAGWNVQCKNCRKNQKRDKVRERKRECVEYKGGACEHCGGVFHPAVFDFHHLDPSEKDFKISAKRGGSFAKLKPELDKCALLCRNCHAMEHYGEDD